MKCLKWFLAHLYLYLERRKGRLTVVDDSKATTGNPYMVVESIEGFSLTIYCREILYLLKYESSLFKERKVKLYQIYAVPSQDAPVELKEACKLQCTFSPLLPDFISDSIQKEVILSAFMDMLHTRLKRLGAF